VWSVLKISTQQNGLPWPFWSQWIEWSTSLNSGVKMLGR
jgi:hypothetical protein